MLDFFITYFIAATSDESTNETGDHSIPSPDTSIRDTSPSTTIGEISEQNQQGRTLQGSQHLLLSHVYVPI